MINPNDTAIQAYLDVAANDLAAVAAPVFPYTQEDVYLSLKALTEYLDMSLGTTVVPPAPIFASGADIFVAMAAGPMTTPEDLKWLGEVMHLFLIASEVANGYEMNPFIGFVNQVYIDMGAAFDAICAAAATPTEVADCAWAIMRLAHINTLADVVTTTDIDNMTPSLFAAIGALTPATSDDFVKISSALDSLRRAGEDDQPDLL